jgi:hypothetical protein
MSNRARKCWSCSLRDSNPYNNCVGAIFYDFVSWSISNRVAKGVVKLEMAIGDNV